MSDTTAAQTLDVIREGGTRLVMLAVQRLEESQSALAAGHFDKALVRCQEAQGAISQLANAQSSLGVYGRDIYMVRASEVEEGMNICQLGVVTERSVESAPIADSFEQAEIVTLRIADAEEPIQFQGEKQLLVWQA